MAGKPLYRYVLTCDGGCGATLGANGELENAIVARTVAAGYGWALVPKLRANGTPGKAMRADGNIANAYDVCRDCQPTFQPEQMTPRGNTYVRDLQEENKRLRAALDKRGGQ
ncbi:hypothetical protein AB0I81_22855 [Nonomuraea sp. NPDC050404]|uniref:hypothetical protein n=1 Tax=Nonomuraea sp. NPDC050404 TaxID=3155783 RepID=UPI0033DC147C